MGSPACLVSGKNLFIQEATSPLQLLVIVAIMAVMIIGAYLAKRFPSLRKYPLKLAIPIAIVAIGIVLATTYISIRPGLSYGAWLNGTVLQVRFYQDDIVSVNICKSNISLVDTSEALSKLSIRTNGLSDPLSGIHMGYYRARGGDKAYVLVLAKKSAKALVIGSEKGYIIVALPCSQEMYKELTQARSTLCTKQLAPTWAPYPRRG